MPHDAIRLARAAMKQILAVRADHFLGHHAKKVFRGLIDADNLQMVVVENHGVREPVEDSL
jgi:hypothetical protein